MSEQGENIYKMVIEKKELLINIIHGYIMGDGYLKDCGTLQVEQSKKQQRFVQWMYEKLKPILAPTSQIKEVVRKYKDRIETYSYRFYTRAVLRDFHPMWYTPIIILDKNGDQKETYKKKLPSNIEELFTPTFIALWYACDGGKLPQATAGRRVKFEVTAFSVSERETLKFLFKKIYGIQATIDPAGKSRTGTQQWALNIKTESYDTFHDLITSKSQITLIQDIFPYKLHGSKNNRLA